ncbi:hypothetical protein GCM10009560_10760 [Nonomuraea longicatena]|uniref:Uncharacterized protein n=1 Tax=Nonomuraea longicatena TaxID=83682 RepID=A0ABN1NTK7_9ACTN
MLDVVEVEQRVATRFEGEGDLLDLLPGGGAGRLGGIITTNSAMSSTVGKLSTADKNSVISPVSPSPDGFHPL